ncbi:MAG: TatD family hydrolase [Gemmatimonadota bacterium]
MNLFDSHCHLTAEAFEGEWSAVIDRAREAGVTGLVTIASDPRDAESALQIAAAREGVWCTAGLHPHEADRFDDHTEPALRRLAARPEVVAIGEAGLDFHYDNAPRDRQRLCFEAQLELARELDLPIVVHSRDADDDTAECLASSDARGVLHCFTAGPELLEAALDAGWMVSFSGIVTFRRFDGADLVRRVPDDRLLIETDSPYLAPVPHRGHRNEPAFLRATCAAVAAMRGDAPEALAERTRRNALSFYGLASDER